MMKRNMDALDRWSTYGRSGGSGLLDTSLELKNKN